jgi:hypothetical protein
MSRSVPIVSLVVDALDKQEAYRKHLLAVSNAKPVIDTSAPPVNRRLELWRARFARDHEMREAFEQQSKLESPVKGPPRTKQCAADSSAPPLKNPTALLPLKPGSRVIQPANGPRRKAAAATHIHFDSRGEPQIAVVPEAETRKCATFPSLPTLRLGECAPDIESTTDPEYSADSAQQKSCLDSALAPSEIESGGDAAPDSAQESPPAQWEFKWGDRLELEVPDPIA